MTKKYLELFHNTFEHFCNSHYLGADSLSRAMAYALTGSGKRVRPLAALLAAHHHGENPRCGLSAAVAVEMVHTYSLIHDDLPCMDDDDWRRGRPSLHRAFDEATALLAGDALLTDAFRVLTDPEFFADASFVQTDQQAKQVVILSRAAGSKGMVDGQSKDMWWTARSDFSEADLNAIHRAKTGALLGASFAAGAAGAGASRQETEAWFQFGERIGIAFQAIDDCLDDSFSTGKSNGKDREQGKLTYLKFHTPSEVRELVKRETELALSSLPLRPHSDLVTFVERLILRTN